MADNIDITAGSGTTIATDDCTTGHVQVVKLAYGADGNRTQVAADADGLLVNLGANNDVTLGAAIPAGNNNIGDVDIASIAAGNNNIGDVDVASMPAPLGAAGAASIAKAEDSASANLDVGVAMMAVRKATPANTSDTDGDYEMVQMSAGRVWTSTTIDAALPAGTNAIGKLAANSGVDIGDTDVTSIIPGTGATNLGKAVDSALGATDTGVAALAVRDDALTTLTPVDGDYVPLRTNATGALWTATDGSVAHDSSDSGTNPIKIGAKADSSIKANTMVADGDRTDLIADVDGQMLVKPLVPFTDIIVEQVSNTNGTSTAFTNFSAVASTRNYITTLAVYNTSATAGYVDIRDGTAGTILFTMPAPAGGGSVVSFPVPLRQTTTNTALAYDVSGALTTVYISAVGFQSKA